jgi:hypothetical protein
LAQTATPVNDPIKQLQNEIRNIQKNYQAQIRSLQKQLDDLKAAQAAAPKPPPPAAPTAPTGLAIPPTAGALPPPAGPGAPPPPTQVAAKREGIFGTGINVSFANTFIEAASIFRTRNETAKRGSGGRIGRPRRMRLGFTTISDIRATRASGGGKDEAAATCTQRQMRPTRSGTPNITPVQRGISAFGIKVQKALPVGRSPANCKRLMASRRPRNLSVDK